ncbi:uncharacterized protein STEHIDRAFT_115138 [Stereum hirsutum FP-91666 SS1]|uniref:uncharacterized protein n=1 Tax=Stereum hirsutum (strain FP-91666) TaxID=721885 RepID=UPI000444A826|nr:uncharacterized protein STEHIDRAFT_115138 [Stereum hirsutum FP-91666 SS1]EIM80927.1 hypothetical protein STEHIDRAFT_115138 [Stereum hirsutum FP-91666 SS1]
MVPFSHALPLLSSLAVLVTGPPLTNTTKAREYIGKYELIVTPNMATTGLRTFTSSLYDVASTATAKQYPNANITQDFWPIVSLTNGSYVKPLSLSVPGVDAEHACDVM